MFVQTILVKKGFIVPIFFICKLCNERGIRLSYYRRHQLIFGTQLVRQFDIKIKEKLNKNK